jgi:UDP-N-acetylmuramate--alanine ligase
LLQKLDLAIESLNNAESTKIRVGVIMGGYSSERHISVESGRNIYEKLSSSSKYVPVPIFLTGSDETHELYEIPVNVMLKDNADDIKEKVHAVDQQRHSVIQRIAEECKDITNKFASKAIFKPKKLSYAELAELVDVVFIALHGRPGEDGSLQVELKKYGIPFNGSDVESSSITINKYETNAILRKHGVSVANHRLVYQQDWNANEDAMVKEIEAVFKYPFITKPADDGCSSAVKKIKNREELIAFAHMMFRSTPEFLEVESKVLNLKYKEEFPQKNYFLIEDLIVKGNAVHFLEVTGGMLTKHTPNGRIYEVFEPSETLATGEVLSLEEKFLAGEGQNITPSRFDKNPKFQESISKQVRAELEKVAKILNIEGYCRIDAFVRIFDDHTAETVIIEINSLPGMTPATCIFHQSAINGYKPYDFIDGILEYGMNKETVQ